MAAISEARALEQAVQNIRIRRRGRTVGRQSFFVDVRTIEHCLAHPPNIPSADIEPLERLREEYYTLCKLPPSDRDALLEGSYIQEIDPRTARAIRKRAQRNASGFRSLYPLVTASKLKTSASS